VVDPYPITSDLRLGPSYRPPKLKTHFSFRTEGGFDRAAQRCVGVGKCRRHDSQDEVMCPSYLATHEERYTTRGRARLLFEMLHGGPIKDRWRSVAVADALDLCLACKGCKSDCPVHVDMATYKAEFRAHHYAWRLRPRAAYSMGRINEVARLASRTPRLANLVMRAPLLSGLAKSLGGIAAERAIPPFARESFVDWFHRRAAPAYRGPRVLLWPDTFNNYFRPQTAVAATRVLEAAGFTVAVPSEPLCCGRPLYDWGWLGKAKRLWRRTLSVLREEIEAGTPLIGLEPACLAAFKDELVNLFPDDALAKRLSEQSVFFSDFLADHGDGLAANGGSGKALVHIHCHQHAVIEADGEKKLLDRFGLDYEVLPSGCCGMAGAFGFERDKYEVSQRIGERVLLPAVRAAPPKVAILTNGFSCREQIEQGTGRRTCMSPSSRHGSWLWRSARDDGRWEEGLGYRRGVHSVGERERGSRLRLARDGLHPERRRARGPYRDHAVLRRSRPGRALSRHGRPAPHAASALQRPSGSCAGAARHRLLVAIRIRRADRPSAHAPRFSQGRTCAPHDRRLRTGLRDHHPRRSRRRSTRPRASCGPAGRWCV
jgi:Fe-S oxidoreductase